jgi:hypothetical protein
VIVYDIGMKIGLRHYGFGPKEGDVAKEIDSVAAPLLS